MKRILITGANSYIGMSFEHYANSHYANEFKIDTVDMIGEKWKTVDFGIYDSIFHVAGIAHADVENVSDETKALYYQVNTDLAIDTANKAKAEGVKQFIFMSSMIVYGGQEYINKDTEPKPLNFYGDSKWQADKGIRGLESNEFKVAVVRPPMIYGKGSKGNYCTMEKIAQKSPIFPKICNQRSMLYVENLCEFICQLLMHEDNGIFFPQNRELVNTSDMVRCIANSTGHKIWITSLLKPFVFLGKHFPGKIGNLCKKAFGSSYYDLEMSQYKYNYHIADLKQSVEEIYK